MRVEIEKSNIILVGSTGTGKTLLAHYHCKSCMSLHHCRCNGSDQAGYVVKILKVFLTRLLQVADYDVKAAEKGIVFYR